MGLSNPVSLLDFTASGTTSAVVAVPIWGYEETQFGRDRRIGKNAKIHSLVLREPATSLASLANVRLVTKRYPVVTGMTYNTVPDEYIITDISSVTLTASATTASINIIFPNPPIAQNSLALLLDVTASGAWSLLGHIGVET
jgi:hypothetical protein